jgi:preprotein translocase subunit YajC
VKRKWRLGDRVVLRAGGCMIGTIMKIGRQKTFNITVKWPNGTEDKVSEGEIKIPLPTRLERFRDVFEED